MPTGGSPVGEPPVFLSFSQSFRSLFSSFSSVAVLAEHLQIVGYGFATLAPRSDVVALHLLNAERLMAERTDAMLSLIGFLLLGIGEGTDAQVSLFVSEQIRVDATLVRHIIVHQQTGAVSASSTLGSSTSVWWRL
jgi:hypothetical protein